MSVVYRVLGLGAVKHDYVVRALAAHPRFELLAICEEEDAPAFARTRSQQVAGSLAVPYVEGGAAAIRQYRPDVACVSPEVERHARLSIQAAGFGLHLVQDKPMALTAVDCDAIVSAVEAAGVRFLLWNRNQYPAIRQGREVLASGRLGKLSSIHVDFFFAKEAGRRLEDSSPETPPDSWSPLGELHVEGIYPLAYIQELTRGVPDEVFARGTAHFFKRYAERGLEDLASVTIRMRDGLVATVCIGRIGRASHPDLGEIRVVLSGTLGTLVLAEPRPDVAVFTRGLAAQDYRHRRVGLRNDRLLVDGFAHALDGGGATLLDARAGRTIAAVVDAARQSIRSGLPVKLA